MKKNYLNTKLIGILRTKPGTPLFNTMNAIEIAFNCGLQAVEITSNSNNWENVVDMCSRKKLNIGVGSIKDKITALEAIDCGAKFFVSPGLFSDVIEIANKYKVQVLPGVYKESDLKQAVNLGITDIKFFPASVKSHDELFKAIREPFRDEFDELIHKGWEIKPSSDSDISSDYIIESPTEFFSAYIEIKNKTTSGKIQIKLPKGKTGFERLMEFSDLALPNEIRTYAVGGVNEKNMHEVITKFHAYGVCPGSGMFNADSIFAGDFDKVKADIMKHIAVLNQIVLTAK